MNANINPNDLSKSPKSYEDFINENMLKTQQRHQNSECDNEKFKEEFNESSELKNIDESESEEESEIDLTTTGSPNSFNFPIDFSNNNNNNNNNHGDK